MTAAATPQQIYHGKLYQLQHHGTPEQVAEFSADGPPRPETADGVTGWIFYYEANTPTMDQVAALLAEMETLGWITGTVRETLAELSPQEATAELKARMVERNPDDQQSPAEAG
ncbi:hypothetical protein [Nocardia brasiliensis]|uniref:hypothetical protein n=1 Tax=Nocardia brasiliensis TaxID=37326 RepID=UPI0002526469|nr:hypothetical protein [Nocardia brasiliensis]OCF85967.1 hypothetical protein AW168_32905 [Nocardia brasiliensis]